MTEALQVGVLVVADRRRKRRVPASLAVDAASRGQLELVLQEAGLAIVEPPAVKQRSDARTRLRAGLEALVDEADSAEVARLEAAATTSANDDLDERFWGSAPDQVTAVAAVVADLQEQFSRRRDLTADSITRDAAAGLLGIAAQSVTAKLESRRLVGVKVGREWRLPRWQFDPDNVSGVLPDLDVLQEAFPGGPVSLSRWMSSPSAEFGGRSPREAMISAGSGPVLAVVRALTAAGW